MVELHISIPMADITWDGDICVTAVISSPLNPFTKKWSVTQIAILDGTSVIHGKTYQNDIDAEDLKYGPNALITNNNNVNIDTDQWDYYGWRPVLGGTRALTGPLAKTGASALLLLVAIPAALIGSKLIRRRVTV